MSLLPPRTRVLILTSNPDCCRRICQALDQHQVGTVHAGSIDEYEDRRCQGEFHAVITDDHGIDADFDGLTLAQICQPATPAILLTSNSNAAALRLLAQGFKGAISFVDCCTKVPDGLADVLRHTGIDRTITLARQSQAALV